LLESCKLPEIDDDKSALVLPSVDPGAIVTVMVVETPAMECSDLDSILALWDTVPVQLTPTREESKLRPVAKTSAILEQDEFEDNAPCIDNTSLTSALTTTKI